MKQLTPEEIEIIEILNSRPEIKYCMRLAMTLSQEQQSFLLEVITIYKDKGIRPDEAWNLICGKYGIPKTYKLKAT